MIPSSYNRMGLLLVLVVGVVDGAKVPDFGTARWLARNVLPAETGPTRGQEIIMILNPSHDPQMKSCVTQQEVGGRSVQGSVAREGPVSSCAGSQFRWPKEPVSILSLVGSSHRKGKLAPHNPASALRDRSSGIAGVHDIQLTIYQFTVGKEHTRSTGTAPWKYDHVTNTEFRAMRSNEFLLRQPNRLTQLSPLPPHRFRLQPHRSELCLSVRSLSCGNVLRVGDESAGGPPQSPRIARQNSSGDSKQHGEDRYREGGPRSKSFRESVIGFLLLLCLGFAAAIRGADDLYDRRNLRGAAWVGGGFLLGLCGLCWLVFS